MALVEDAQAEGIDVQALRSRLVRIGEVPFDAVTARMTTVHRDGGAQEVEICKGSPEAVLDGLVDDSRARAQAHEWAIEGRRVLAVAARSSDRWRLLGLVALADPPRAAAKEFISAFRAVGVRPVMITGDHPATAKAIGVAVGLTRPGEPAGTVQSCLAGEEHAVYARVRPEQKTAIVAELRHRGQIVAMTGDGVNDAPALRSADIGVAMGRRGTEVAKQAADLVLVRDDLSAMVPAIAEGRRAYDNLRRFLHYALSGGIAEILIMLVGPFAGFPIPLQAGQILWVNLLTHGLPGVAMGSEPAAPDVLARPPRPPREQLLDPPTARRVVLLGSVIALLSLLAGAVAKHADRPWQSTVFLTLACAQLAVALALRPPRAARQNPLLPTAVLLNVLLMALAVTWTPLIDLLHTAHLTPRDWLVSLAAASVAAVVARIQINRASGPIATPCRDLGPFRVVAGLWR